MPSLDTPQRLIEAAGPIFARKGFNDATVREICDDAGANLAAVSYHFGDKEGLYLATVRYAREFLHAQCPQSEATQASAEEQLATFVYGLLFRLIGGRDSGWHFELINREILQPTAACKQLIRDHFRDQFGQLKEIVAALCPRSCSDYELEQLALAVTGQCFHYHMAGKFIGLLTQDSGTHHHYRLDLLAAQITQFSLTAIRNWPGLPEAAVPIPPVLAALGSTSTEPTSGSGGAVYPWSHQPLTGDASCLERD